MVLDELTSVNTFMHQYVSEVCFLLLKVTERVD